MNSAAAWLTILTLWGAVMAATIGVQTLLDRRCDRRFNTHTDAALALTRHPSHPRYTCHLCGDTRVIHMDTHVRLAHRARVAAPEDRDDWGGAA